MKVATAAFPLDTQDIARSCATFGVSELFVVHPDESQRKFLQNVADFWKKESSQAWNSSRSEAMSLVKIISSLDELPDNSGTVLLTSASVKASEVIPFYKASEMHHSGQNLTVVFGTGHGLHSSLFEKFSYQLPPIPGTGNYNHLSVRSAAAIILYLITLYQRPEY